MKTMKSKLTTYIKILILALFVVACQDDTSQGETESKTTADKQNEKAEGGMSEVHLSELKFNSLDMEVGELPKKLIGKSIMANGQLEVPPQYEASVTAIVGANVTDIKVIEGDAVNKGQVLGYLSHPNLAKLQSMYVKSFQEEKFLKKELDRQKRLYEAEVGSGKAYQQAQSDYYSAKAEVSSYESQLRQLNLNLEKINNGNLYDKVPIVSPIKGFIEKIQVQIGQYVNPQDVMFMIVNNDHIHADLMVFEKDVSHIKEGQRLTFKVQSASDKLMEAEIYSVGKKFEQDPKAVHVHAEIKSSKENLIPGMYINAKIHTEDIERTAIPSEAIVEEEEKTYMFTASQHDEDGKIEWAFSPIEIKTGLEEEGWVEVKLLNPLPEDTQVALMGAYYLISEMKKSQTSHSH